MVRASFCYVVHSFSASVKLPPRNANAWCFCCPIGFSMVSFSVSMTTAIHSFWIKFVNRHVIKSSSGHASYNISCKLFQIESDKTLCSLPPRQFVVQTVFQQTLFYVFRLFHTLYWVLLLTVLLCYELTVCCCSYVGNNRWNDIMQRICRDFLTTNCLHISRVQLILIVIKNSFALSNHISVKDRPFAGRRRVCLLQIVKTSSGWTSSLDSVALKMVEYSIHALRACLVLSDNDGSRNRKKAELFLGLRRTFVDTNAPCSGIILQTLRELGPRGHWQ